MTNLPHTGCADFLEPLEADLTWIVQCPTCKKECEVQLIVRVAVQIHDGTTTIKTMLTSPIIEKFLSTTSTQIIDTEEVGGNIHAIVEKELNGQTIVTFSRAYETTYQRQPETRIFLINGHKTQEGQNSHTNPEAYQKRSISNHMNHDERIFHFELVLKNRFLWKPKRLMRRLQTTILL